MTCKLKWKTKYIFLIIIYHKIIHNRFHSTAHFVDFVKQVCRKYLFVDLYCLDTE
jgi:hypothetical protein